MHIERTLASAGKKHSCVASNRRSDPSNFPSVQDFTEQKGILCQEKASFETDDPETGSSEDADVACEESSMRIHSVMRRLWASAI